MSRTVPRMILYRQIMLSTIESRGWISLTDLKEKWRSASHEMLAKSLFYHHSWKCSACISATSAPPISSSACARQSRTLRSHRSNVRKGRKEGIRCELEGAKLPFGFLNFAATAHIRNAIVHLFSQAEKLQLENQRGIINLIAQSSFPTR